MRSTELILLEGVSVCKRCFKEMEKGDFAVKYSHKNIGGNYCDLNCLEKSIDTYLGGGLMLYENDLGKIVKRGFELEGL